MTELQVCMEFVILHPTKYTSNEVGDTNPWELNEMKTKHNSSRHYNNKTNVYLKESQPKQFFFFLEQGKVTCKVLKKEIKAERTEKPGCDPGSDPGFVETGGGGLSKLGGRHGHTG